MHTVTIFSAQDFERLDLVAPTRFQLRFPRAWQADPRLNPHAAAIDRETLAWLRAYGVGCTPAEAEALARCECGGYGGYSLPRAERPAAILVTQFIALWLFWDDVQVETETGWDLAEVIAALQGAPTRPGSSRYAAARYQSLKAVAGDEPLIAAVTTAAPPDLQRSAA